MVRIPLIRRQPKDDLPQGKDGKGKDGSGPVSPPGKDRLAQPPAVGEGKKPSLPLSPPDKGQPARPQWLGTGKKLPFPLKPTDEHEVTPPPRPAVVERTSIPVTLPDCDVSASPPEAAVVEKPSTPVTLPDKDVTANEPETASAEETSSPESRLDGHEVGQPPGSVAIAKMFIPDSGSDKASVSHPQEAAVAEETALPESAPDKRQPEQLPGVGITQAGEDALAVLRAMPDYIFRIGQDGVSPVVGGGSGAGVVAASCGTGGDESSDGKAAADERHKLRPLEKIIREELSRQSQQHTEKVLETRQLETFEFQVRDEKEVHHLEVRLTPFGQSEVLAFVRDVTLQRQTHNALIESRNELENHLKDRNTELIRVNKMLKTEVELRGEQEEILKKNFHRLEGLLEDTIGAITLIVERRDPHIADHQRRVSLLSCAIGKELNLRNDQMRAIRMAAQLHDLGKIFVPAEILRKPGKLSEAEVSIIKTHPDTDYQILKRIDFPISIADIVRQHHERMDGSGYPQGLKGSDTLVEARILAVSDVVEGMVFERPYRVAPGLEAALKEIADQKGTLYDPAVVDSCLKLFAEGKFKFEPSPGQESPESGSEPSHKPLVSAGNVLDRRDF